MKKAMIRLFDDPLFNTIDSVFETISYGNKPRTFVDKTDNGYKITISVPGLTKDDLKIIIKSKSLSITYENIEKTDNRYFVESFSKSYIIPDSVIIDEINAEVKNGILQIDLPTKEKDEKEKIIKIN